MIWCTKIMSEPIRNSSGKIGCPRCLTSLQKKNAPFKMYGEYVGNFESYVCPMCNYSALTESGYDKAVIQARQLAISQDIPEIKSVPFRMGYFKRDGNDQTREQIQQSKQEIHSSNDVPHILDVINDIERLYADTQQVTLLTKKTGI